MIHRILVPLDGSDLAEGVLPVAEDLARRLPAQLHLLQVVGLATDLQAVQLTGEIVVNPDLLEAQLDDEAKESEGYLARVAAEGQSHGIDTRWAVARGLAVLGIVEYARSNGVNLIAMSTHGRSGLSRMVFGSVADQVLREGGLPVLLIRPGEKPKPAGPSQ